MPKSLRDRLNHGANVAGLDEQYVERRICCGRAVSLTGPSA
jgi:hypothetical protein